MSDIVDTSPLGIERTERIAGDEALNSRLDTVTTELQSTQESVTTEVLHRSEGDLVIQRILEGYIQDLLEGKAEDFERYIEFQNSQNLNYADVRNFVSSIRTSLADEIRNLSTNLMDNLQANDARYNKLVSDVGRYLEILSDITLDSNQITLDNGELRAGAWTILSQARAWDLEIINRLNGISESVGDSLKDAVEDIQNQLPSTEETITKAIEELSKSPLIKELSDLLNQSIENDIAYELALLEQARQHANDMAQLAEDMRAEALAKAQAMEDYMAGEVTARITEVNKEVAARKEAIDLLTEDMLTRVDQDKADFQAEMLVVTNRIKSAEDGLTSEIQHRKDEDTSTLNALNTYKVSNDSAITGLTTSLSNNVTKTNANTTLITGLTARMTTAETGIESATTAAADAMSKATTAVSANNALSVRVDALAASITESDGTVVDVNAFNALKAEVSTVKGTVTGLVEDVTALESNYTTVNNKVTSQGTAIGTLNTKMTAAENSISQSANDITLLKTDISSINAGLLTKVDSQAFSQLSSDVSELDGKYTTQAGLVTDLRGSLDTTNVNVGNAASAAQNALNTAGSKGKVIFGTTAPAVADRLSQNLWIDTTGGANTPKRWNGSAWVVVTDKVATDALAAANAATNLANTKADTSAFNSLDQKVTVMDGKVNTNTNSITSLNGKIAIVEGDLATKLDSSAMVNYYTKQQADANALSTAAGEISKYDASLVIGGVNLISNPRGSEWLTVNQTTGWYNLILFNVVIDKTKKYTVSFEGEHLSGNPVKAVLALSLNPNADAVMELNAYFTTLSSGKHSITVDFSKLSLNAPTFPEGAPIYLLIRLRNERLTASSRIRYLQVEEGSKATAWTPNVAEMKSAVEANATAITNTNTEVSRVDGKTTTNANAITGLTSRMGIVEGQVSTKAEASALQNYYTKTEAASNATTVAAGEVAKYNAALKIGSKNLLVAAKWKTPAISSVNKANGYEFTLVDSTSPYTGAWGMYGTWTELEIGTQYVFSFKIKALDTTPLNVGGHITGISNTGADAVYLDGVKVEGATFSGGTPVVIPNDGKYHLVVVLMTKNTGGADSIYIQPNRLTSYTQPYNCSVKEVMLTEGNAYSQWVEPDEFIQGQIDANATAITNTNSEVARVDGKVTANSSSIASLNSSVSTLENTKLNASVIAGYYTKSETDVKAQTIAAGEITKYDSSLVIGGVNQLVNSEAERSSTASSRREYLMYESSAHLKQFYDDNLGKDITISFEVMVPVAGAIQVYSSNNSAHIFTGVTPWIAANTWTKVAVTVKPTKHTTTPNHSVSTLEFYGTYDTGRIPTVRKVQLEAGNKVTDWSPSPRDIQSALDVNASAISTTNTEVSRINGVVSGHTTQLSNLTASVAGKADTSALNALTVRVAAEEGKSSSQATSITNLTASLSDTDTIAKGALPKVGGAGSFKTFKEVLNYYLATSGTASNIVIETPITFTANMFRISGKGYNYASTKSVIDFEVSGYAYQSTGTILQHGAKNTGTFPLRIRLGMKNGKLCVILSPQGTNFAYPAFAVDAAVSYGSVSDYYQTGWSASPIAEASLASSGITAIIEPSLLDVATEVTANASAVSTLDTKVIAIDGKVTTQASQLVVLTSDNNANKNALTVQGKVIDGVKSSYMVKMETNGVIGGFGLIQSTGALGQVVTSFGVNANAFFIGAPASNKKPFIVTTANQVVNGVTYPAGTYIDVALIANATIGTAKIANLAVTAAKIANATITNAEIANATITGAKIANATIGTAQIANLAVTAAKIANATITAAEIANATITGAKIANATIGSAQIADAAITTAKIGNLQVDTLKIKDNAVTVSVASSGVPSLAIVSSGGKVRVEVGINGSFTTYYTGAVQVRIVRNGTVMLTPWSIPFQSGNSYSNTCIFFPLIIDTPPAGTHTYKIQFKQVGTDTWYDLKTTDQSGFSGLKASIFSIALMEVKK